MRSTDLLFNQTRQHKVIIQVKNMTEAEEIIVLR